MADAFISYSRKDKAFATALKERLEVAGFEILFDLEDILGSEDWAKRLVDMIAGADHFVFVISPDSCQSRVCSIEINTALDLSKSIVPVALRDTFADLIPPPIGARQWINCLPENDPASCAEQLGTLFQTSPEWLRYHTELTSRARDWHLSPRRSALLRGADLRRAEHWLETSEGKQPLPSGLQIAFIRKSRQWRRASRAITGGLLALVVASAAVGWVVIEAQRRLSADSKLVSIAADWMSRDPTRAGLVLLEVTDPERTPYAVANLAQLLSKPIAACEKSGHPGGVRNVAFSPSGEHILTLAGDEIARLWSSAECQGQRTQEFTVKGGIKQVLFTSDSEAIVAIGSAGGASLWRIDGTQVGAALDGEFEAAWLARTGDVVAVRRDFTIELWGINPGLERKATFTPFANRPGYGTVDRVKFSVASDRLVLETHGNVILAWTLGEAGDAAVLQGQGLLALSPDGASYARASFTEQRGREYRRYHDVLVRPIAADQVQEDLHEAEHEDLIDVAAFSPNGRFLVTASGRGLVQVSDLSDPTKRNVSRLERHTGKVRGVVIAAASDRFVTFAEDRTAWLGNLNGSGTPIRFQGHIGPVMSAAFSPDGRVLVTGSDDGTARLWQLEPGPEPLLLDARGSIVTDAWFTPDDAFVVARSHTPETYIEAWQLGSAAAPIQLNEPSLEIKALARHPHEPAIALASRDGDIVIRRIAPDAKPRSVGMHPGVNVIAFDDSGSHLVSASDDGHLQIWNLETGGAPVSLKPKDEPGKFDQIAMSTRAGRILATSLTGVLAWPIDRRGAAVLINKSDELIEAAAFDPTGTYVATAHAWDYRVRLWHADGSGLVRELGAATESIEALRFSPDGKHLIVASKDETVRIWPTDRASAPLVLRGHTSWVVDAEFSRDSTRVATASYDGSTRVWNVDGSDEELVLDRGNYSARFDGTGSRLVTAGGDRQVVVWSLDARRVQAAIAARTRICLDEAFRTRFLTEDTARAAAKVEQCQRTRQQP